MSYPPPFNPLTATAAELAALLDKGKVTSVDIVQVYLRQIQLHNYNGADLNCIISIVPEDQLLEAASRLDSEREEGKVRSPYHGVPFIVKVCQSRGSRSCSRGLINYRIACGQPLPSSFPRHVALLP